MTQSLAVGTYTADQVYQALITSGRTMRYRYEWLNADLISQGWLDNVVAGASLEHGYLRDIKRTIKLTMLENASLTGAGFDYLNDLVRPWVGVAMPDGGWAEWPQGAFLTSSPTRSWSQATLTRDVDGYDQTQILADSIRSGVQTVNTGTNYQDALSLYLNTLPSVSIVPTTRTLATDRSWEPGTSDLAIARDLCAGINYTLAFDGYGVAKLGPYSDPDNTDVAITYDDTGTALMWDQISTTLDLAKVPNVYILAVSQTDRPLMISRAVNNDPASPVSLVSRGREIVSFTSDSDAATQADLDDAARAAALAGANIYETVEFSTVLMPIHEDRDVMTVVSTPLGLSGTFVETGWTADLKPGGQMKHVVRRAIPFDVTELVITRA